MRSAALTNFISASVCAERSPCFHALRFPFGAPQLFPPCILHRCLPLTAGDRHSAPDRVRASQRGALARFAGCMGLSVRMFNFLAPAPHRGCLKSGRVNFSATLRDLPPLTTHGQLCRIPMVFGPRRPCLSRRCRHTPQARYAPAQCHPRFHWGWHDRCRMLRLLCVLVT